MHNFIAVINCSTLKKNQKNTTQHLMRCLGERGGYLEGFPPSREGALTAAARCPAVSELLPLKRRPCADGRPPRRHSRRAGTAGVPLVPLASPGRTAAGSPETGAGTRQEPLSLSLLWGKSGKMVSQQAASPGSHRDEQGRAWLVPSRVDPTTDPANPTLLLLFPCRYQNAFQGLVFSFPGLFAQHSVASAVQGSCSSLD